MKIPLRLTEPLSWFLQTLSFLKKHAAVVLALGLVAAFGRVLQLGGFGRLTPGIHLVVEVAVESARLTLFLYVLGWASVPNGVRRVKRLFTDRAHRTQSLKTAWRFLKSYWFSVGLNVAGFLLVAAGLNYLIDALAYQTCLLLRLKQDGILTQTASEWTILLFFKNLSVIPFTLVFDALFLLWITSTGQRRPQVV